MSGKRSTEVPTIDEFDALQAQVDDHERRITALEGGTPPDPIELTPSPDGTVVSDTVGVIVDSHLRSFQIAGADRHITIDGEVSAYTRNVARLEAHGGVCYQTNAAGDWWYMPEDTWESAHDPNRPAPDPDAPNGSIKFDALTGRRLRARLFGIGTGALQDNYYARCDDPLTVSQLATIAPRCFRLHAGHKMAEQVAQGDTTSFDKWVRTFPQFLPSNATQIIGVGPPFDSRDYSPKQRGEHAAALAQAFIDAGCEQFDWEVGNECEALGVDLYSQHFVACADALHAVNPDYRVGGTVGMWWGSIHIGDFVRAVTPQRLGFFVFHAYPVSSEDAGDIYQAAANWSDASRARNDLRAAGVPDDCPIRLGEWNMDGANHGGVWGNPAQIDHRGAVYFATLLRSAFEQDPNFDGAACWDAVADSYFGQIGPAPDYDNNVITPSGHYLRLAGAHLRGDQVEANCELSGLLVLAAVDDDRFVIQCINHDQGQALSFNPEFSGATAAEFHMRYVIGKGAETGAEEAPALPIVVPSESVVIVTGSLG